MSFGSGFLRTVREHPPYQTCCVGNRIFLDNPSHGRREQLVVVSLGAVPEV